VLIALPLAAFVAGLAGTWSPCGLSAIDTLGTGGRPIVGALGAFAAGAVAGGAASFTALGALGSLAGTHVHGLRVGLAIALAGAAALADLRGARVRPQIRRQVPEPWRRHWPLTAAAGAYGILLGLGFTTYVLAFVLWAAAALTLALGSPLLGLGAGVAFGLGRALPVIVLAPIAHRPLGLRLLAGMAERPAALRAVRRAGGAVLAGCALVLALAPGAAASVVAAPATDPSVSGARVAWQVPGGEGMLRRTDGGVLALAGHAPALGDGLLAYLADGQAHVVRLRTGAPIATFPAPGVVDLAVSARWLVMRLRGADGGDALQAVTLAAPGAPVTIAVAPFPAALGRPAIDGDRVVWATSTPSGSTVSEADLASHRARTLLHAPTAVSFAAPSLRRGWLLYVRQARCIQELRLRSVRHPGHDRRLLARGPLGAHDPGHEPGHTSHGSEPTRCRRHTAHTMLWTTALSAGTAYVTLVALGPGGATGAAAIAAVPR
jgi:hypothetical protein